LIKFSTVARLKFQMVSKWGKDSTATQKDVILYIQHMLPKCNKT